MAGQSVSYPVNGVSSNGYLALPQSGRGSGLLVIQEWWGLNDQIRETADRFAAEGFVALVPDLYHGRVVDEPDEAGKLMMALDIERAAKDLRGAAQFLSSQDAVSGARLGVIGFCMGGQLALYTGALAPDLIGVVVDMYGIHPNVKPDFSRLKAPVLGLFGGQDGFVPAEAIAGLDEALIGAGVQHDFHTYPAAGHAFMNDRHETYDPVATEDAWGRILPFFRQHLS
ncbi:MAG: dienelactone hydrolase family protein [Chloroflexi bacterium]|nr:dienelactone hydrolase family protein [Chloroflexota bacterium]